MQEQGLHSCPSSRPTSTISRKARRTARPRGTEIGPPRRKRSPPVDGAGRARGCPHGRAVNFRPDGRPSCPWPGGNTAPDGGARARAADRNIARDIANPRTCSISAAAHLSAGAGRRATPGNLLHPRRRYAGANSSTGIALIDENMPVLVDRAVRSRVRETVSNDGRRFARVAAGSS